MNSTEKDIYYTINNSYSTLNTLTEHTKNIWFVCHGLGYLSRFFLKYFKGLNPDENYIIAPQAQSKYYQSSKFEHVGASWLTKENTGAETENVMAYFDAIFAEEAILKHLSTTTIKLNVFGYSQGVSVAMRYVAKRQLQCSQLILHSGGIPSELLRSDLAFFKGKVTFIYGDQDQYINPKRLEIETEKANSLFGNQVKMIQFEGKHEVNVDLIKSLA
ncbi:esterase [Subsaximicrobium wynnwilliamsii]|jgi:predicted esterase|uniref:Esterase n=1 Tax=Subsaximicrobium wynnwilliamsii TaxID=291179 RepID=A0A5C6ZJP8_9FLAO|nr:esterase [Subsaximicrobium wynnwilliamsii]TXD84161.1 esterase [Subsaximicrobium wynnwilliamsii]TXD89782.1 esterase [Subsaximicrobium wynnwilliamsii]TXE03873.1 esterase [Subsaximicrobium wynnwilliamsii]